MSVQPMNDCWVNYALGWRSGFNSQALFLPPIPQGCERVMGNMGGSEGQRCRLGHQASCGVGMELIELLQSRVKSSRWQASHLGLAALGSRMESPGLAHSLGTQPPFLAGVHGIHSF